MVNNPNAGTEPLGLNGNEPQGHQTTRYKTSNTILTFPEMLMIHSLARARAANPLGLLAIASFTILISACEPEIAAPTAEIAVAPGVVAAVPDSHGTNQRSFDEFLAAQGTYCVNNPSDCVNVQAPLPELGQFANGEYTISSIVDYFGQADPYLRAASGGKISLGSTVEGSVTERPLKDGRAEIDVIVRATNILIYAAGPEFLAGDPLFFGATVGEILAGASPAVGTSFYEFKFITSATGLPLPDLVKIVYFPDPGQESIQLNFHAQADGLCRAASGFPEGTPGRLSVHQVAIFNTKSPRKAQNPFTVETITLTPRKR